MDFKSKITLWLRHIWVKYRRLVLVIFIGWLIIFMINMIIKNRRPQVVLKNTYDPDTAVITNDNAPTRYQDKIKAAMDEYIKHCNNKDYNSAFDLLTDDCKDYLYGNSLVRFQNYVDSLFKSKKIYNYQAFSIFNGYYIYDVTILDDIGATGTTGNYDTFTEKYTFSRQNDGSFKIKSFNNSDFVGDIALIKFNKMNKPYMIENINLCMANDNYKWLEFYDYNKKYRLTAMYNENNEIIEWYFDIARKIGNEKGMPYEDDLYLDVVVTPKGDLKLLDEDELKDAFDRFEVNKLDYEMAYNEAKQLMNKLQNNKDTLKILTDKYLKEMLKE